MDVYPFAEAVCRSTDQYKVWLRRLVKMRNALKTGDLSVAGTLSPSLLHVLLASAGLDPDRVQWHDSRTAHHHQQRRRTRTASFRPKLPKDTKKSAMAAIRHAIQAWKRLAAGTRPRPDDTSLVALEAHLRERAESLAQQKREQQEARENVIFQLLMTPGDAMRVRYHFCDSFGIRCQITYKVEHVQLRKHTVAVCFRHTAQTIRGDRFSRPIWLRFRLVPGLPPTDPCGSALLLPELPAAARTSLKGRAALCLARHWTQFGAQSAYTTIAQGIFCGFAERMDVGNDDDDDDDDGDDNKREGEQKDEEEDKDSLNDSVSASETPPTTPTIQVHAPSLAVHVKIESLSTATATTGQGLKRARETEFEEEDDWNVDLSSRLARIPDAVLPPPPKRQRIVIDLTFDD